MKGVTLHTIMQPLPLLLNQDRERYGNTLAALTKLIDDGLITPLLDKQQFAVEDVAKAHEYFESGDHIGKVVLTHS